MSEVKLFGAWFSPPARRVQMALELKGIEYEYIEEDLKNKSPLLVHYNPIHKRVPVLVHNGKAIAESMVILEYIDEVWEGPSILPKDPYHRAMSRFWAKFVDEKCNDVVWKAYRSNNEKMKKEAEELLKLLEDEIKGKKFFGGDHIGLVDFVCNSIAILQSFQHDDARLQILTKNKFPNLCKWAEDYRNDRFVSKFLPDKERLAATFNKD